jgi:hypothetical protein
MATNSYSRSITRTFQGIHVTRVGSASPTTQYVNFSPWTDTITGVKLRDWKRRIAKGEDATTDMDAVERTVDHSDGFLYRRLKRTFDGAMAIRTESGFIRSDFDPPDGVPQSLDASAASRDAASMFYRSARNAQTQLLGGVTIGELRETLDLIHGRGKSFEKLFQIWANRLRRRPARKSPLKAAADAWLEFQFGWRPIAGDISGALAAWKKPRLEIAHANAFAKRDDHISSVKVPSAGIHPLTYSYSGELTSSVQVKIRGGIKVETKGVRRNLQAFGLLPDNWINTAYELLPWTWLIDYFTDLGGVINSLTFPSVNVAWASTSVIKELKRSWLIHGFNAPQSGWEETGDEEFIPQVTVWRKKAVSRRRGVPEVPSVTLQWPRHWQQWANIFAVVISKKYARLRI